MTASKLRIRENDAVALIGDARGFAFALPKGAALAEKGKARIVTAFVATKNELTKALPKAAARLATDGILWLAYPKAKQLGTDLHRDVLASELSKAGWETVSLVSLDEVWSAMRVKQDAALGAARQARGTFGGKAKKPAAKEAAAPKAAAKKASAKKTVAPKKAVTPKKAAAPKAVAPKKAAPKAVAPKKAAPKATAKKAAAPKTTAKKGAAAKKVAAPKPAAKQAKARTSPATSKAKKATSRR